jgi:hypothetical protein
MSGLEMEAVTDSPASVLCRSCGLCCSGHLFIWAKLRPAELDPAEALGMHVFRSDPRQRGFSQPCPLWEGECTIYGSPQYPHACRAYKCKLLKQMLVENISLADALKTVDQAKGMIQEVERLLPASSKPNFRERLVAQLEDSGQEDPRPGFHAKAAALLAMYENVFGVTDVIDKPDDGEWGDDSQP